jgi:hypothetical protein
MKAKLKSNVPRTEFSLSGWRAIASTAEAAALPCPIPGPIAAKPTERPAAITEAAEIIGFILNLCEKFTIYLN